MKILVCAKQVPNTKNVTTDPVTGRINREGVESILNPDDANALEAALQIKDQDPENTTVTVISMGPDQAKEMLIECMAMGADDAILLSDRKFGGSDTWATSNVIAAGMAQVGDFDLILGGRQAIDGDTAQVGPQIAEKLGIPQVTYAQKIDVDGRKLTVQRQLEDGYETIEIEMPCMITCVKELNEPRYMNVGRIYDAYDQPERITVWGFDDIDIAEDETGLKPSPTNVFTSFAPAPKGAGKILEGTDKEVVDQLIKELAEKSFIAI
jgi:electron transfer flavoprotein beta subunit